MKSSISAHCRFWLVLILVSAAPCFADEVATPAYTLEVVAPSPVKEAVLQSLDLTRWQSYTGITPEFFELLLAEARTQARGAAETEGYFSAKIDSDVDRSTTPMTVRIRIELGQPTMVTEVSLTVTGEATQTPAGAAQISALKSAWSLPTGTIFRQAAWAAAKGSAVRALAVDRYAAARLTASQATIDPETRTAQLTVSIDSGPPFDFGQLEISGLQDYAPALVQNLTTFRPGDPYSAERLDTFVRRLNGSGYFSSAEATISTDPAAAPAAPVRVRVIEAPRRKISTGIGFSTDTLYRGQLTYDTTLVDRNALRVRTDLDIESKIQSATLRLRPAPSTPLYADGYSTIFAHTDISGLRTDEGTLDWTRKSSNERNQTTYLIGAYASRQIPSGAVSADAHALYFEYGRTWRNVDNLLTPGRGNILNLQIGVAPPGASTTGFARGIAQFAQWIPLNAATDLVLKAEAGAVSAKLAQDVPIQLLFRTGGDTTVRGYEYQSLGPRVGDATVGGKYYALASVEVVRWVAPSWGVAIFVDAGNAADNARDLSPALGYGVGARLRTPIGPFRLDVAYGQETHGVRLHLSVGLSF
jgi:translocation and assembly module TamA